PVRIVVHVRRVAAAVDLLALLGQGSLSLVRLFVPCSSTTSFAMTTPLAFTHGPDPMRSRALTAPGPCVLRYARQVFPPAPTACARIWQIWAAPERPPRSAPLPEPTLVTKKLMLPAGDCPLAVPPSEATPPMQGSTDGVRRSFLLSFVHLGCPCRRRCRPPPS